MSNRNFDNRVIIQRLQNQNYSRNLYLNNTSGQTIITNPQNSDGNASRFIGYVPGAQTEYFRGLIGSGETISVGGIVNIPPFIEKNIPQAPTIDSIQGYNTTLAVLFTPASNGGSPIVDYQYSIDNGVSFSFAYTTQSPIIIQGLTNGITYSVIIRAVNAVGVGFQSSVATGTPNITTQSFTSVGSTSWIAPVGLLSVNYLIVAGGGGSGGGFDTGGGGGGGGGMVRTGTLNVVGGSSYNIVVGDGGIGGISIRSPVSETNGSPGENSLFGPIISLGGGGGYASRQTGGVSSGGGTVVQGSNVASTGGSGGGSAGDGNGAGGGGGGNTTNGNNGVANVGGTGGAGISNSISGSAVTYGQGGGGANGNATAGNTAVPGASNTGNGARGGGTASGAQTNGAKGGSGIVIIQY